MNVRRIIQQHWKGALVGGLVVGAGFLGGPIAGKAVGWLAPKALQHVSDTPITDVVTEHKSPFSREAITHEPTEITLKISPEERRMLADVAKDWHIEGRLRCAVVPKR